MSGVSLGVIIAENFVVVLLLLLLLDTWRRYHKQRSIKAGDLENPRVLPGIYDEVCSLVSGSFYPSARIVVVLTMGRKVIRKQFKQFIPRNFE